MCAVGSCANDGLRPLACCGAAGPLRRAHPEDAARVAVMFAERADPGLIGDARCAEHLRAAGAATVVAWLDAALTELPDREPPEVTR